MGLDRKITIIRDSKNIGEIYLLCSFYIDNYDSSYIVYAKDDIVMENNSNIVYFGKLRKDKDDYYLISIRDEDELSYVKKTIKELFRYSMELEEIKRDKVAFNKKLEIPKNIFENPYNNKDNGKDSNIEKDDEIDSSKDNREYRNRLKSLAEDIKDIKPIDKDIPDTLYIDYYNEMGLLLKSKLSTLKQLWVEYKLIYNEKQVKYNKEELFDDKEESKEVDVEESFSEYNTKEISSDFDDLLDSLSNRIEDINDYLDELRELKNDISIDNYTETNINEEKEKLRQEKEEFEEYKRQEEKKLKDRKKELQLHYNKFQTIVDSFDKRIKEVK